MLGQRVDLFKLTESHQCCRTTSTKLIELGEIELVPTGRLHPKFLSLWCRKWFYRILKEKCGHQPSFETLNLQDYIDDSGHLSSVGHGLPLEEQGLNEIRYWLTISSSSASPLAHHILWSGKTISRFQLLSLGGLLFSERWGSLGSKTWEERGS